MIYKALKKGLFCLEPEIAHQFSMFGLKLLTNCIPNQILKNIYSPSKQFSIKKWGLEFKNPIGLAAGFDKNADYLKPLSHLGFGFIEIGTVTPKPQIGNPKPRLLRLPEQNALINRMGFNNKGVEIVTKNLELWRSKNNHSIIIGGNIGKNKMTDNKEAWKDYLICFKKLYNVVDYFVVNVSSPNTPNLRDLQDKDALEKIFSVLQESNFNKKPLMVKIAPDLTFPQIEEIIMAAEKYNLQSIIACNTSINRSTLSTSNLQKAELFGNGGLSGQPIKSYSTEIIQFIKQKSTSLDIIASGGIFNTADIIEKKNAGASLFQIWTGFIYEGPLIVKKILENYN